MLNAIYTSLNVALLVLAIVILVSAVFGIVVKELIAQIHINKALLEIHNQEITSLIEAKNNDPELLVCPDTKDTKIPTRAYDSDAGYDVYCPDDIVCPAHQDTFIPLGWSSSFRPGWAMIFKDKSGVASKLKLSVCSGVVDAAYRGPITVHFRNSTSEDVVLTKGQKISQFMMVPVGATQPKVVASLDETERGTGGFGSTGTH